MEHHLEAKSEELQRSNKDLEQFAYVASHDLKAPLRAIEVIIEWLRDDLEEYQEGDVHENLNLLSQRTRRLACLLDDLLAYSRAGRKVGDVRKFEMRDFVQDIATLLAPPQGFRIIADESLPTITAHHAPLETVLRNLISNAIKHHPNVEEGVVRVYAQDQGDSVLFSVEDNGEGIPEQYAERVFQMFQTLKPRDDTEGSGMGLAIVQRIVNWQKGNVWFTSGSDGKGTTFKFTWNKVPTDMPTIEKDESDEQFEDKTSKDIVG
jgi:light-regulated signal transduction histidine kinase (bacteriophytochrome)